MAEVTFPTNSSKLYSLHPLVRDLGRALLTIQGEIEDLDKTTTSLQNQIDNLPLIDVSVITSSSGAIPLTSTLVVLASNVSSSYTLADGQDLQVITISVKGTTSATITPSTGSFTVDPNSLSIKLIFTSDAWAQIG